MRTPPCDWHADDRYASEKNALADLVNRMHDPNFRPPTPPGLTGMETFVLLHIGRAAAAGVDIRPTLLARHARMTPSAISQMLKTLEEKGCIVRSRAADDSRKVAIDVTDKGAELIEQARQLRNDAYSELLDYLGPDDVAELMRILGRIADYAERAKKANATGSAVESAWCADGSRLCDAEQPETGQSDAPHAAERSARPAGARGLRRANRPSRSQEGR